MLTTLNYWIVIFLQNGEIEQKRQQECDQRRVASQMEELKMAKRELEQEVDTHKTRLRLHFEAQVWWNWLETLVFIPSVFIPYGVSVS